MFLTVEKMQEQDIDTVKEIEVESSLSPWSKTDYIEEIGRKRAVTLVAKNSNEIIGFLCGRITKEFIPVKNKTSKSTTAASANVSEGEIYNIAVKSQFRRKGVGSLLLKNFYEAAKDHKTQIIWLEVRKSNAAARNFYLRQGFTELTVRKNLYKQPTEDGILMRKKCKLDSKPIF